MAFGNPLKNLPLVGNDNKHLSDPTFGASRAKKNHSKYQSEIVEDIFAAMSTTLRATVLTDRRTALNNLNFFRYISSTTVIM